MEERRRHAMERRKSVEKRLEEQRKEKEELNQLMADKINTDLKRAQSMKESKEKEQILVSVRILVNSGDTSFSVHIKREM